MQNEKNTDDNNVVMWACIGKDTQKWQRKQVDGVYEDLCKEIKKDNQRFKVCPGKKNVLLGNVCKKSVIAKKNGTEVLVKQCGDEAEQWEIAKCHRYKADGAWMRECGKNHLEKVDGSGLKATLKNTEKTAHKI